MNMLAEKIRDLYDKRFLYYLYAIFILVIPILITLDKYIGNVGTILTGVPCILGIINVFLYQRKKRLKYIIVLLIFFINIFFSTNLDLQVEFMKTLLIFLTCFDIVQDKQFLIIVKKTFEKYYKFIIISISIILLLNIGIFSIQHITSIDNYSDTWNIEVFEGLYSDPHQAAYRFCALIIYILFLMKARKGNQIYNIVLLLVAEVLLLMTGARTPTALGMFFGLMAILCFKKEIKEFSLKYKKIFVTSLVIGVIAIAIILPQTAFIQKSLNTKEGNFDNGRSKLIQAEWSYYMNESIVNKFLGNDITEIYEINRKILYKPIWCHNDIMQVLLQFGIIMLIIYFETIIQAMIYLLKNQSKLNKAIIILLNLVFLFVAFYNGLFYFPRFVIVIPIIFMIYKLYNEEKIKKYKEKR